MLFRRFAPPPTCLLVALALPAVALAQSPPPGAIFDLFDSYSGTLPAYTPFAASFVATGASEYVSFAFRDVPRYFSFDDASVTLDGSSINLLSDPGFEDAAFGQNCNHNNTLGCPAGWGAWIQPVDTDAIGQVATVDNQYGCAGTGPYSGSNFWCDGSVQGYDAVYQQLNGLSVGSTYQVNWRLAENSDNAITRPEIDMLVYAGGTLPDSTIDLAGAASPEPGPGGPMGLGLAALALIVARKRARA